MSRISLALLFTLLSAPALAIDGGTPLGPAPSSDGAPGEETSATRDAGTQRSPSPTAGRESSGAAAPAPASDSSAASPAAPLPAPTDNSAAPTTASPAPTSDLTAAPAAASPAANEHRAPVNVATPPPTAGATAPATASPADGPVYETVVSAGRVVDVRRVAGSAHVITERELERHEHNDIHRVLDKVPGVYLRDEDGFGLRPNIGVRGATSDRSSKVTLMEDGILFGPAPYSAPAAYYFPLVTRMVGLEVYKGPASIRFGPNTIGGALNLLTRHIPEGAQGGLDVSLGGYRSGKAHGYAGFGGEHFGVLLEGLHLQTGGFKVLDGGGDTGFAKNELMLKAHVQDAKGTRARHRLELKLGYSDEVSHETYLGLSNEDFEQTPLRRYAASQNDLMTWWRTQAELGYLFRPTSNLEVRAVAYRHDFDRTWSKVNGFASGPALYDLLTRPATGQSAVRLAILRGEEDSEGQDQRLIIGGNGRRFVSQGVQVTGRWERRFGPVENALELGARFHHDEIERHHTEDAQEMLRGTLVPTDAPTVDSVRNNGFARALAFHLQDELSWKRLLFAPGLRVEHLRLGFVNRLDGTRSTNTSTVFLPGAGAVLQLTKGLSALAGVHVGFSPVSPGQSAEVQPEKSVNYEAGLRYRRRGLRAELVGFFDDYFNLTGECTFSTGCEESQLNRQFNAGAVHVYGLEAAGGARIDGPLETELALDLAYTLTLSRFRSSFLSEAPQFGQVDEGDELPYVPVHQAAASVRVSREPWSVALSASYVGAMREVAGQGEYVPSESTDPRLVLDLAGHVALSDASEIYVTLNNLLDTRYLAAHRPFGARPGAPRMVHAGFKYHFR